jgi:hypothetical protein
LVRYKPARPALATAICFYEIVVVLFALVGRSFDHWLRVAHPSRYYEVSFPQIVASEFSYAVALFAAILVWRMRPVAAPLLAIRAIISLLDYLYILTRHPFSNVGYRPQIISSAMIHGAIYVIGLGIVALNISIAGYAYKITARRWMTRAPVSLAP